MTEQPLTIGEVFPPTEPLAQWVVVLSMAVNDLSIQDRHMHAARKAGSPEMSPYFRLICSHFHELALHFRRGRKQEAVASFLDRLGDDARHAEGQVISLEATLSPARQSLFHYRPPGDERLAKAIKIVARRPAKIGVDQEAPAIRFRFADHVADAFAFGDVEADMAQFGDLAEKVAKAVSALARFTNLMLARYCEERSIRVIDGAAVAP